MDISLYDELFKRPAFAQNSDRVYFVDLAKGICILLVVLYHMRIHIPMVDYLRMPLYFVLSGLFFKDYGLKVIFVKKINKLIVPLIAFNIISVVYLYLEYKFLSSHSQPFNLLDLLLLRDGGGVIWFLLALFWDNMLFAIMYRCIKNRYIIGSVVISLAVIGYLLGSIGFNEFFISSALLSLPFFYIGIIIRPTSILSQNANVKTLILALSLVGICILYSAIIDDSVIIFRSAEVKGSNILTSYILGIVSVIGILLLCKLIEWLPIISFIGRYSIIVLCTHMILINAIGHIRQKLYGTEDSVIILSLTFLIIVGLSVFLIKILRDKFPYICAQKDIFKVPK